MPPEADRSLLLDVLEQLLVMHLADDVDEVLTACVETACTATDSRRGMAGLSDGGAVTARRWYDVDEGWSVLPQRWELGQGGPGRVCHSGTPLVCNELPTDATGLDEATDVLRLTNFACLPLPGGEGVPLGFLEVGGCEGGYAADDVRRLTLIARHCALRLRAVAGADRLCAEERLVADTCLSARGLFSLDPEVVLSEIADRLAELVEGTAVALRYSHGRLWAATALSGDEDDLLRRAVASRHIQTLPGAERGANADERLPALVAIPLLAGGQPAGVVLLRSPDGPPAEWQHGLMEMLAERAGVALEHATLYETQHGIARRLQERLLPSAPPAVEGLDIHLTYRSSEQGAERGGDFVDFHSRSAGQLAVAIGDVAGKGVEAMATAFIAKYALHAAVLGGLLSWPTNPGDALREVHNSLVEELPPDRFVTLQFALVNARLGTMSVANAGHPAPFVLRGDRVERPLIFTAPAIGVDSASELAAYPTETIDLGPGDAVVLFTDGIAEARDRAGRLYEDERMAEALDELRGLPSAELVERLIVDVERYASRPLDDDAAVVCIRLLK